jgi:hypothetical protein
MVAGDFNNDGKLDLATLSYSLGETGCVCVVLGNGKGGFGPPLINKIPLNPGGSGNLAVGDFNGDGNLDIAAVNQQTVEIYLGNGDGTFHASTSYSAEGDTLSVAVGDFNGDGFLDLAVVNNGSNSVSILLGNGDGTFQTQVPYAVGNRPLGIAVGDFNSDGRLDLAVTNSQDNTVAILLGKGDGSFLAATMFAVGTSPNSVAVADFNGDGALDLAVANSGSSNVSVLLGNGHGTFGSAVNYSVTGAPYMVAAGALSKNGVPGIIVGAYGISVLAGKGDGTFSNAVTYDAYHYISAVALGHFGKDNLVDIAGADLNAGAIIVLPGKGRGIFLQPPIYPTNGGNSVKAGDINNDGILDLVLDDGTVLLGKGNGLFQPGTPFQIGSGATSIALGDVNGDGNLDVVTANPGRCCDVGFISVALGNGDGTFQPFSTVAPNYWETVVALGDFNGDGILDIAAGNDVFAANELLIMLGNGDGTFQTPIVYPVGGTGPPNSIAVGDFNGDGILDLAVGGSTLAVLLGNGDGTFGPTAYYPYGWGPVVSADFDGDGILDLAVGGNGYFVTLKGNGDGTFQTGVNHTIFQGTMTLAVGDFNGDGLPDLAVSDSHSSAVTFLLGLGNEDFQQIASYAVGYSPAVMAVGDFDGRGKPSLAVASPAGGSNNVTIVLNAAR